VIGYIVPTVGAPNQGGKHDSRRFNKFGSNPLCFGSYWADLLSGFIWVIFTGVIEKGNDDKRKNWIGYRAAVYVPVSHKQP
jgi:hypothetical protein